MSKYSYEDKLNAVLRVTEQSMSINESARILGTAYEHVRRWVKRYEKFGSEGLTKKAGYYSGEFKISVIEYMHKNNLSLSEVAVEFGIPSDNTVGKWERIYYEEGKDALLEERRGRSKKLTSAKKGRPPKKDVNENEDLLAEVQRLRMENDYLKKLNALIQEREKQQQKSK